MASHDGLWNSDMPQAVVQSLPAHLGPSGGLLESAGACARCGPKVSIDWMCTTEAGVFRLGLLDPDALCGISAALIASMCLRPALLWPLPSCSQQHCLLGAVP